METKPLAIGTLLKGRYRVVRLVAGGGMAWVYEVEELRPDGTKQIWALKELRADADDTHTLQEGRQLFEQEANILVHLSHPNLPKVAAFFEEQGRSYLVMEFIHGESLEKRLERANAPLLEGQVLDCAIQICEVLSYLHTRPQPVIFRDLKPSNVMVTPEGRIKLIDFGIARTYKVGKRKDTITMGSENYAAPEQWGKAQTDPRADIYALGATMYHLLTNVPPLPAFVPAPRLPVQQYNPAVTDRTAAVIEKAMAEDRDRRYASALEMRTALLECLPKQERQRIEARSHQTLLASGSQLAVPPRQGTTPQLASQTFARSGQGNTPDLRAAPSESAVTSRPAPLTPGTAIQPYSKPCPKCTSLNRPAARFCRHCGYAYVAPLPPVLALVMPPGARWEYPLRGESTLIGRQGGQLPVDLDIGFYDPEGYVSRNHARITVTQRRYQITDLGSSNGTFVNEERLTPHVPRLLSHGDQIRLGRVVLAFRMR